MAVRVDAVVRDWPVVQVGTDNNKKKKLQRRNRVEISVADYSNNDCVSEGSCTMA